MEFMNKSNVKIYTDVNEQRSKLFPFAYLNVALTVFRWKFIVETMKCQFIYGGKI